MFQSGTTDCKLTFQDKSPEVLQAKVTIRQRLYSWHFWCEGEMNHICQDGLADPWQIKKKAILLSQSLKFVSMWRKLYFHQLERLTIEAQSFCLVDRCRQLMSKYWHNRAWFFHCLFYSTFSPKYLPLSLWYNLCCLQQWEHISL